MKKVVCLWSGGIDSSYLVDYLARRQYEVIPLYVAYPHRSLKEEIAAIVQMYVSHFALKNVQIPVTVKLDTSEFLNVALTNSNIRASQSTDKNFKETKFVDFVPARNIMFLSIAASVAWLNNTTILAIASHKEELFPFPDSSREFLDAFENALDKGTPIIPFQKWRILTPFVKKGWYKWDVLQHAIKDGFPVELTLSCYTPINGKPCKKCRACQDRMDAFKKISEMPR